jgi:ARG and Rhodanese-Phosphatase-superfamily-associated Protein domain
VAWSDIFASSELFDAYWPKLLRSYAVEALTRPVAQEKVSLTDARDFLRPAIGHVHEETEPGVYRWRERSAGRVAEIELEALEPKPLALHWLKVLRTS